MICLRFIGSFRIITVMIYHMWAMEQYKQNPSKRTKIEINNINKIRFLPKAIILYKLHFHDQLKFCSCCARQDTFKKKKIRNHKRKQEKTSRNNKYNTPEYWIFFRFIDNQTRNQNYNVQCTQTTTQKMERKNQTKNYV